MKKTLAIIALAAPALAGTQPAAAPAPDHILNKHFMRKHGPNAYYGQKK